MEIAASAIDAQKQHGGFSGAELMHRDISADYWGITWESFEGFMGTVRESMSTGSLMNTGSVPYEPMKFHSTAVGPNMYQVNDQVITPMTKADPILPGVSWAFKDGSLGAKVTIFVTHAWQEGAFEFEEHLKRAWQPSPDGSRPGAAYICFLSNPQNLDISSLCSQIDTSPFKVALDRMPKPGLMIMCSTKNGAIHERAWCVFEAFMAIELEIPIAVPGTGVDLATNRVGVMDEAEGLDAQRQTEAVRGVNAKKGAMGIVMNLASPAAFWYGGRAIYNAARGASARSAAERAAEQAGDGHLVDINTARCSVPSDEANIKDKIEGKEAEINRLVGECIMLAAARAERTPSAPVSYLV